jgi:hypothetical protein
MITGKNTNHKGGAEMTDYTKDQFISELAIFACTWVDEKMVPVMERADELWENEFARIVVKKHAQFKLEADVARKNMALAIADGDKLSYESQKMIYESNSEKRSAYSSVLYDVLINNEQ